MKLTLETSYLKAILEQAITDTSCDALVRLVLMDLHRKHYKRMYYFASEKIKIKLKEHEALALYHYLIYRQDDTMLAYELIEYLTRKEIVKVNQLLNG